jgi:hypothetical protein
LVKEQAVMEQVDQFLLAEQVADQVEALYLKIMQLLLDKHLEL